MVTATHIDRLARGTLDLSGIVERIVDAKAQSLAAAGNHGGSATGGLPTFASTHRGCRVVSIAAPRPAAPPLRIEENIACYDGSFPVPIFSATSPTQRLEGEPPQPVTRQFIALGALKASEWLRLYYGQAAIRSRLACQLRLQSSPGWW